MAKPMKYPIARTFGSRYGKRNRDKFGEYQTLQRRRYKCPYCKKIAVKRVAAGIWECRSCGAKFTSKAYFVNA